MDLSITKLDNNDSIVTNIRLEDTMTIRCIRLRLFKYGNPDGDITLTLKDSLGATIGTSTVQMSDLNNEVGTYFHGYVKFDSGISGWRFNKSHEIGYEEVELTIQLNNHSNDESNYISLCRNFASDKFIDSFGTIPFENNMSEEQLTHFQPYGIEVYRLY